MVHVLPDRDLGGAMTQGAMLPAWVIVPHAVTKQESADVAQRFLLRVRTHLPDTMSINRLSVVPFNIGEGAWPEYGATRKGSVFVTFIVRFEMDSADEMMLLIRKAFSAANTTIPKVRWALGSEPEEKDFHE